jgi:hypothetical protein
MEQKKEKKTPKPVIDTQARKRRFNPEKDIRTDLWEEMELSDLYSQRLVLADRALFMQQKGLMQAYTQMQAAMRQLETYIEEKTKNRHMSSTSVLF